MSFKKRETNYGICMMRIIFVFLVICFHFHANWDYYPPVYIFLREMTVPVFLLIAFFLGEPVITGDDNTRLIARMKRLFIPYLFWGVASWVCIMIVQKPLALDPQIGISELLWQLAFGCVEPVNPPLYYLWMLMIFTLLFVVIYKIVGKKASCILLAASAIVCLFIQYDGRATIFFKGFRYEIMYSVGRIYELIPYAIMGFVLSAMGVYMILMKHRAAAISVLTVAVPLLLYFRDDIFPRPGETLAFSGVSQFVTAPLLFLWFLILPIELLPKWIKNTLKFVSDYTLGIFAIHWPLGKIFDIFYERATNTSHSLTECVIIFVLSFVIVYLIGRLPGKLPKMLVR